MADEETQRPGIEDVARATGVSIMSVSRAMRGVEGVSAQTRARIVAVAQQMGYVPNRMAGSLAAAGSTLIGISVPTFFDAVFAEIIEGMRGPLHRAGFDTMIETSDYSMQREDAWIERVITWSPAAIVLSGVDHSAKARARLARSGIPTLEIWDVSDDPIDLCVGIDHHAAGIEMGAHLVTLGYRRPAYIGIAAGRDPCAERRYRGLSEAFGQAGIDFVADIRIEAPSSFETGRRGCAEALDMAPDVLCFLNDHLAFGGSMECTARGLAMPQDIGVVGFNDLGINAVLPKRLTTSVTPRKQIGTTGARLLIAAIRGVRKDQRVILPVGIEPGETTRHLDRAPRPESQLDLSAPPATSA